MRKAQSAIELVMLVAFIFLVSFSLLIVLGNKMQSLQKERDKSLLEDMGKVIKQELVLAGSFENGYSRDFFIPNELDGKDFTVDFAKAGKNHTELTLQFTGGDYEVVLRMPSNITGTLQKGKNSIIKDGLVCLNIDC